MKKLLFALYMMLGTFLGVGVGEVIDDKVKIPVIEKIELAASCPDIPLNVIAYTDSGKYFCNGIGPDAECESTEEILSKLG